MVYSVNNERSVDSSLEANAIVETTLQYANKVTSNKKESIKFIAKFAITVTCLLGIFICTICDMAVSGTFTWSLYAITSIVFLWLIVIPLFQFKKNNVCMSLISLSIFIIPFLFLLNKIIGGTKFMLPIGIPVSLIAIAYMWGVYLLFSVKKALKWNMAAISILLGIPVSLIINCIVVKFTKQPVINVWDILSWGIQVVAAIILFLIGRNSKTGRSYYNKDNLKLS